MCGDVNIDKEGRGGGGVGRGEESGQALWAVNMDGVEKPYRIICVISI